MVRANLCVFHHFHTPPLFGRLRGILVHGVPQVITSFSRPDIRLSPLLGGIVSNAPNSALLTMYWGFFISVTVYDGG